MAIQPLSSLPSNSIHVKRALLSVFDKTGLIDLAKKLHQKDVELISTGGTARHLREAGLPVREVSELTGFPEILDGRVKTLHPYIHGAILARTSHQPDLDEIRKHGIEPIELVVANLYPFDEVAGEQGNNMAMATEYIDIGGPTLIRAAAKNFAHVSVLTDPGQYQSLIAKLEQDNGIDYEARLKWARDAFRHTAGYDQAVAGYFDKQAGDLEANNVKSETLPERFSADLPKSGELRYGENPHQAAAVYGDQQQFIECFHGKPLSYNNYMDIDSALRLMTDFVEADPTCAIFKHNVPCGVSTAADLCSAYERAFQTDTVSPFGGIIVTNKELDVDTAEAINRIFSEVILAPSYTPDALELLRQKKNRRLITIKEWPNPDTQLAYRSIFGGALVQQADPAYSDEEVNNWEIVTQRRPSDEEWDDLTFGWKVVKHVGSNGIVYSKDRRTLGIGTGQPSRVDSSRFAIAKAESENLDLQGSIVASDAFFPFADGVKKAAEAGAKGVIQPGGSIRDEEVIEEANRNGMTMIFTHKRHFRH